MIGLRINHIMVKNEMIVNQFHISDVGTFVRPYHRMPREQAIGHTGNLRKTGLDHVPVLAGSHHSKMVVVHE
jgi:hypothetical protein